MKHIKLFEQFVNEKAHKSSGSTYLPDYYGSIEKHFTDERKRGLEDAGIKVTPDDKVETKIKVEWSTEDQAKNVAAEVKYLLGKVFNSSRAKSLLRDWEQDLFQ